MVFRRSATLNLVSVRFKAMNNLLFLLGSLIAVLQQALTYLCFLLALHYLSLNYYYLLFDLFFDFLVCCVFKLIVRPLIVYCLDLLLQRCGSQASYFVAIRNESSAYQVHEGWY